MKTIRQPLRINSILCTFSELERKGPFFLVTFEGSLTVKNLRVDGANGENGSMSGLYLL